MSAPDFSNYLRYLTDDFNAESIAGPPAWPFWIAKAQSELTPENMALLLESLPLEPRVKVFTALHEGYQTAVFMAMLESARLPLLKQLDGEVLNRLLASFDAEALLELSDALPDRFVSYAFDRLDAVDKERFERASKYGLDQVGHWVSFEFPVLFSTLKPASAIRVLKRARAGVLSEVAVQNKQGVLLGEVPTAHFFDTSDTKITDLTTPYEKVIEAETSMDAAADIVIASGRYALPVVEQENMFLGYLTRSMAYEHRAEVAEQKISVAGGLTEDEDLFAPVWRSSRNRAIWLGINLLTAFLASWCIGLFEITLQKVVALAILMPVVASMGGISGSQTLTVIVRALALGKISDANRRAVLIKELKVGIVNGLAWAAIIGLCVFWWFESALLGMTMGFAILVNICIAALCGVLIPALLDKFRIDPALSGAVVLTTVTDVVGFIVFLGVGTLVLT